MPEALDLMARALRAGHAFSVGMKMIGDEFPDPIGPEFSRTVEEISFGIDVPQAMANLNDRVISTDLKFFITALVVQRETGGNLAEIIEAISRLIRQRFELLGRVKALSAEGRMSGIILFCMPIVMTGVLWFLNEPYIRILIEDEIGRLMALRFRPVDGRGSVCDEKHVRHQSVKGWRDGYIIVDQCLGVFRRSGDRLGCVDLYAISAKD